MTGTGSLKLIVFSCALISFGIPFASQRALGTAPMLAVLLWPPLASFFSHMDSFFLSLSDVYSLCLPLA